MLVNKRRVDDLGSSRGSLSERSSCPDLTGGSGMGRRTSQPAAGAQNVDGVMPGQVLMIALPGQPQDLAAHRSVYDEQPGTLRAARAVRALPICHLVAAPRPEREPTPVAQLGDELSREHEHDVAALAPVVGEVSGRVIDHSYPYVALLNRAPACDSHFSRMLGGGDLRPISGVKWDALNLHCGDLYERPAGCPAATAPFTAPSQIGRCPFDRPTSRPPQWQGSPALWPLPSTRKPSTGWPCSAATTREIRLVTSRRMTHPA